MKEISAFKKCVFQHFCLGIVWVLWIFIHLPFVSVDAAGSSVLVHDDPTSRGPTAAAADTSAADSESPAAPSPAAAAESTHVTPGKVFVIAITAHRGTQVFDKSNFLFSAAADSRSLQESAGAAKYAAAAAKECRDC